MTKYCFAVFTPNHAAKYWIHTRYRGFWHVHCPDQHFHV